MSFSLLRFALLMSLAPITTSCSTPIDDVLPVPPIPPKKAVVTVQKAPEQEATILSKDATELRNKVGDTLSKKDLPAQDINQLTALTIKAKEATRKARIRPGGVTTTTATKAVKELKNKTDELTSPSPSLIPTPIPTPTPTPRK